MLKQTTRILTMTDYEELVAGEVHTLLLSAKPGFDDRSFASAAELASLKEDFAARRRDDFRAEVVFAMQEVRSAIIQGASYSERKRRLQNAVNSAHSWLNARRFPSLY
jgi:hypothetical protein